MKPASIPALLATIVALALPLESSASIIVTPTGATSSSTIGSGGRVIGNTIDGLGLSGVGDILTQTHALNTTNSAGSAPWTGHYWLSASGAVNQNDGTNWWSSTEVLTFTLPALSPVEAINALHLWNYDRVSDNPTRALRQFDVSFSTDGGATFGNTITLTDFLGPNSPGYARVDGRIPVQSRFFDEQLGVTHIRIDNIFIQGANAFMGFSEIRFGAVVIPEPGRSLLGAFGLMCLLVRRNR